MKSSVDSIIFAMAFLFHNAEEIVDSKTCRAIYISSVCLSIYVALVYIEETCHSLNRLERLSTNRSFIFSG